MLRLACSTNTFRRQTLEEAITILNGIGYRGVQLMADVPHTYLPGMTKANRRGAIQRLRELGTVVSNVNASALFACGDTYHPTWIEDDKEQRKLRVEHTLDAIAVAAEFGAGTVGIQPGGPMIGAALSRTRAGDRFAEGIVEVLPAIKERGLTLCIDPEPGLFIQSAAEYVEFKQRYFKNDDAVRMSCGVGHLFCVGEDPADVIRRMPDQICHIHLEDVGKNRVHEHLVPGTGSIDFAAVMQALKDVRFGGWMTVELYPYEDRAPEVARAAYEHLRPMLE